ATRTGKAHLGEAGLAPILVIAEALQRKAPRDVELGLYVVTLFRQAGRLKRAAEIAAQLARIEHSWRTLVALAAVERERQHAQSAIEFLKRAAALEPEEASTFL